MYQMPAHMKSLWLVVSPIGDFCGGGVRFEPTRRYRLPEGLVCSPLSLIYAL